MNKISDIFVSLTEGFPGNGMFIDEEKKIQAAFKPWEKFGKVTIASPKDDGDEFFNVKVHCTYPVSSAIINDLNKRVASKVTFSDSNMINGSCEVGSGRGALVLEFFVDFPS